LHRANASLLIVLGLLACATAGQRAAIGWSLGGEAHVFIAGDRFARDMYHQLTGKALRDALAGRPLVAVDAREPRSATVLSASGAAPGRLTLARFHAPHTCGDTDIVTELVFAFPPDSGPAPRHRAPRSHATVVALLDRNTLSRSSARVMDPLAVDEAKELVHQVALRAETATRGRRLGLLHPPAADPDAALDAGEVVPLATGYAVGFRVRFVATGAPPSDTMLITGVAVTDLGLHHLQWVVRPRRVTLVGDVIQGRGAVRYSVRGEVVGDAGRPLLLIDEFADIAASASRATAVDAANGHVVAAQPLALRCP
jgi:hypothetical protein